MVIVVCKVTSFDKTMADDWLAECVAAWQSFVDQWWANHVLPSFRMAQGWLSRVVVVSCGTERNWGVSSWFKVSLS